MKIAPPIGSCIFSLQKKKKSHHFSALRKARNKPVVVFAVFCKVPKKFLVPALLLLHRGDTPIVLLTYGYFPVSPIHASR